MDGALAGGKRALADSLREGAHPLLAGAGGTTLVSLLGRPPEEPDRRVLAVRALAPDGGATPWLFLGARAQAPALAAADPATAYAAWIERTDEGPRLRAVRLVRR